MATSTIGPRTRRCSRSIVSHSRRRASALLLLLPVASFATLAAQDADPSAQARERTVANAEPVRLNDDGAWCWFQDERALSVGDEIIFGSIADGHANPSRRGSVEVTSWNLATGSIRRATLHERLQRDDHAAPAFLLRPDGRLLAAYSKHGNDASIRFRVSRDPGDALHWDDERVVEPSPRSRVTYSNLHRLDEEHGRTFDFFRGHDNSFKPSCVMSPDDGASWVSRGVWIDVPVEARHRPYVKYASNGRDEIHFLFTEGHPRDFDNSLYHALYRDGSFFLSDGTRIGSTEEAPLTPARATRIFRGDANHVAWSSDLELDETGRPAAAYSVQIASAGLRSGHPDAGRDHRYRYARFDGERWHDHEVAHAGGRLYPGEDDYTGTICIDPGDTSTVYFSTNVDPRSGAPDPHGHWQIWRGHSDDGGATWSFLAITRSVDTDHLRPIVPRSSSRHTVLLWLRGEYRSYTDWRLEVVGRVLERGAAIER